MCSPQELQILDDAVFYKDKKVDLIYRFWELFDYENVLIMPELAEVVEKNGVVVTPHEACSGGKIISGSFSSSPLRVFLERDNK